MPATLRALQAASRAKAAANSIIGAMGEDIILMRAITANRVSLLPAASDPSDSQLKQDLDDFEFPNQREDQETTLMAPQTVKGVRSKIQQALEALDVAGVTFELPEAVESEMILMSEQDIPTNSILQWYDWAITHPMPNQLLLNKITADSTLWDDYTAGYTPEQIATALDNIENNFPSVFRSMQSLLADYEIMKKINMFIIDKDAVNDPPVAMFYYVVPREEPDNPFYVPIVGGGDSLIAENGDNLITEDGNNLITEG